MTPHPWKCFEQPLQLNNESELWAIPQSHISTTMFLGTRDAAALRAKWDGRVWDLDTGHDMMITAPDWVADKLAYVASITSG